MIIIGAYEIRGMIYTAKKNLRKAQESKRKIGDIPGMAKKCDEQIARNKKIIADMIQMAKDREINLNV